MHIYKMLINARNTEKEGNQIMSLRNHIKRMQSGLARSKGIYDARGVRWSVNPVVQLWRLRFRAIYLVSMAGLWLQKHPSDQIAGQHELGDTIREWRNSSASVGGTVTRTILAKLCQSSTVTLAELEVLCAGLAGRSAINTLLKTGVKMKLLTQSQGEYRATDLLMSEAYDRTLFKLLDPKIVEFAEFVVMFSTLRKNADLVGDLERDGNLDADSGLRQSIPEALFNEVYNEEIDLHLPGEVRPDFKLIEGGEDK